MKPDPALARLVEKLPATPLPFVGLVIAAVVGIGLGEWFPLHGVLFGCLAAVLLLVTLFRPRCVLFFAAVVSTFAALHACNLQISGGGLLLGLTGDGDAAWEMEGTVAESPPGDRKTWLLDLARGRPAGATTEPIALSGTITVRSPGRTPEYGEAIRVTGSLRAIAAPRNPGQFDYRQWQIRRGIYQEMRVLREADVVGLRGSAGNQLLHLANRAREHIRCALSAGMEGHPEATALVLAMTLGDDSGLSETQKEQYRVTGTLHLFSVSGLHVGMIALILWAIFKPLSLPQPVAILCIIGLLFFYSAVTGMRPSSLRAAFMASMVLGGLLLERPALPMNSLAAAAFLLLLQNTNLLFDAGFQLSFLVVFAILLLGTPTQRWLRACAGPDAFLPRRLYTRTDKAHAWAAKEFGSLAAVSGSAWVGSLPLIAAYYHLVSLSAIPVNLLAVPMAFGILAVAMLSLLSSLLSTWVAEVFNFTNVLLTGALAAWIQFGASIPFSAVPVPAQLSPPPTAEVVIFDVGAGGCSAIRVADKVIVIDVGSEFFAKGTLGPWVADQGMARLTGMILTHGDRLHVGGARWAIESLRPGYVAVGPLRDRSSVFLATQQWMRERQIPKRIVSAGDRVPISPGWTLEVLYPPRGLEAAVSDDKQLVLRLLSKYLRILWIGDAGVIASDWLMSNAQDSLGADLVVLGRHQSGQLPSALIEATGARWLVVSVAEFPNGERLSSGNESFLRSIGPRVLQQDRTGAVIVRLRGKELQVEPFLQSE